MPHGNFGLGDLDRVRFGGTDNIHSLVAGVGMTAAMMSGVVGVIPVVNRMPPLLLFAAAGPAYLYWEKQMDGSDPAFKPYGLAMNGAASLAGGTIVAPVIMSLFA